jgi:hypothetical protein
VASGRLAEPRRVPSRRLPHWDFVAMRRSPGTRMAADFDAVLDLARPVAQPGAPR